MRERIKATLEEGVPASVIDEALEEHGVKNATSSKLWHADHITPLWAGGEDTLKNLQTLCQVCHFTKTKGEAGDRAKRARMTPGRTRRCGSNHTWRDSKGQPKLVRTMTKGVMERCLHCKAKRPRASRS